MTIITSSDVRGHRSGIRRHRLRGGPSELLSRYDCKVFESEDEVNV